LLAYFIHVDVLRGQVLNSPDIEQAKAIMDDVRVLKRQFSDNSRIRILSLGVHTVCYSVFGALKQPDLQQSARDEGLRDAAVLEKNELTPEMAMARWYFYDTIGEPERAVEGLQAAIGKEGDADAVTWYASYLYRIGNFEESIKVLETLKGEVAIEFTLLMALAEQSDDLAEAWQLYEEIASRPDLRDWDLLNQQLILRFLGEKERAVELSRRILNEPEKFPLAMRKAFSRSLEYCAEECSSEELLTSLAGNSADECCAHFCIALTSLSMGDREDARRHFELCEATGQVDFVPHVASRMILSKMKHDEKWPGWIKKRP
jgi:tetratricopeptide (TPR) repeat protein